jgi:hypothetical protein
MGVHTSTLSGILSTLILSLPSFFFYAYKMPDLMLFSNLVILFVVIKKYSGRLWQSEINKNEWGHKWAFLRPDTKKNKYKAPN